MEHNHQEHHTKQGVISKLQGLAKKFELLLAPIYAKAPNLPHGLRTSVTKILPYFSLGLGIITLTGIFLAGRLSVLLHPFTTFKSGLPGIALYFTFILAVAIPVLSLLAFKPLMAMRRKGWEYLFQTFSIAIIIFLVQMLASIGGTKLIPDFIVLVVIGYIFFQVREKYL